MRKSDPEVAKQQKEDREAFKRNQQKQIIAMSEQFERSAKDKGFNSLMRIIKEMIKIDEFNYSEIVKLPVKEILKDSQSYLCKRVELETSINRLKNIIEIPNKYLEETKRILSGNKTPKRSKHSASIAITEA